MVFVCGTMSITPCICLIIRKLISLRWKTNALCNIKDQPPTTFCSWVVKFVKMTKKYVFTIRGIEKPTQQFLYRKSTCKLNFIISSVYTKPTRCCKRLARCNLICSRALHALFCYCYSFSILIKTEGYKIIRQFFFFR